MQTLLNKKILVTGANGFVGTALIHALNKQSIETVATVRGNPELFPSTCKVVTIPTIDRAVDWAEALREVEIVVHLAARVHVMKERSANPLNAFLEANLHGTVNLAEQAVKAGVKRFIFISSIGVNGLNTAEGVVFNEQSIAAPHNDYAHSKFLAEEALKKIGLETGMDVVIIRPPLIYGPNPKGNFKTLLNVVANKIPMPLAAIQNKRSFIYLDNLIDAIITCSTHPNAANKTYLVSDDEVVSTPQFIRAIAKALGGRNMLFSFPISIMRFFSVMIGKANAVDRLTESLVIDSSKIRQELNWPPPYTLEQGLQATADWYLSTKNKLPKNVSAKTC